MFPGVGFDVGKPKEDERFQPMTGLNKMNHCQGVTRHITKTWALRLRDLIVFFFNALRIIGASKLASF